MTVFQSLSVISSNGELQPRVRHQDIDTAELAGHAGEHGLDLILLAHVGLMRNGATPSPRISSATSSACRPVADHHVGAGLAQGEATALPMPELAPVTSAFWPLRTRRTWHEGMTTGGCPSVRTVRMTISRDEGGRERLEQLGDEPCPAGLCEAPTPRPVSPWKYSRRARGGNAGRSASSRCRRRPAGGRWHP